MHNPTPTAGNAGLVLKPCHRINTADTEYGRRSRAHTRHGHTLGHAPSPTYHSWAAMLARCRYVDRDTEAKHVGRGIGLDPRWYDFSVFLADMGERPAGTTLDRINNDGDYGPGNCRWATPTEQARNRRNARLTYERAVEICLAMLGGAPARAVAARYGCSESLPREILKGRTWRDASVAAHAAWSSHND